MGRAAEDESLLSQICHCHPARASAAGDRGQGGRSAHETMVWELARPRREGRLPRRLAAVKRGRRGGRSAGEGRRTAACRRGWGRGGGGWHEGERRRRPA